MTTVAGPAPCFHIATIDQPQQLIQAVSELRCAQRDATPDLEHLLDALDAWSKLILDSPAAQIPGAIFLSLWLRRSTLMGLLHREFGSKSSDNWDDQGKNRFRRFPVGLVAHWPAANVPTLPVLSPICALLGGNVCLIRVPSAFVDSMRVLLASLSLVPGMERFAARLRFVTFAHDRLDLQETMASASDGAMIWGGQEAVDTLRRLPFPYWARLMVFGPRLSVAALDRGAWQDQKLVSSWCQRLARDVWQFEQAACSSPQVLFVEQLPGDDLEPLIDSIESAFRRENNYHPRESIDPSLSTAILRARAQVQVDSQAYGVFPLGTDWTLLVYRSKIFPTPTQGRTLHIVPVQSLEELVPMLDGSVQTLGLGMTNPEAEMRLAELIGRNGVDRIVKIGMMHVFDSPWDGYDLVQPMTRKVRHLLSQSNL